MSWFSYKKTGDDVAIDIDAAPGFQIPASGDLLELPPIDAGPGQINDAADPPNFGAETDISIGFDDIPHSSNRGPVLKALIGLAGGSIAAAFEGSTGAISGLLGYDLSQTTQFVLLGAAALQVLLKLPLIQFWGQQSHDRHELKLEKVRNAKQPGPNIRFD